MLIMHTNGRIIKRENIKNAYAISNNPNAMSGAITKNNTINIIIGIYISILLFRQYTWHHNYYTIFLSIIQIMLIT